MFCGRFCSAVRTTVVKNATTSCKYALGYPFFAGATLKRVNGQRTKPIIPIVIGDFKKVIDLGVDEFKDPLLRHLARIPEFRGGREFELSRAMCRTGVHEELFE